MVENNLPADPLLEPGGGVKIHLFRTWYAAYQIKENHTCRKMEANILPSNPLPWWVEGGVKVQLFQNMVMWQIKLKGMEHKAPCKHIFSPYTHPQPVG